MEGSGNALWEKVGTALLVLIIVMEYRFLGKRYSKIKIDLESLYFKAFKLLLLMVTVVRGWLYVFMKNAVVTPQ